jgi:hypothetical protein
MPVLIPMPALRPRELPPAGSHIGVCYALVELGTQSVEFEGKRELKSQLRISFELPGERMSDNRPFVIGRTFTYSSDPRSALRCEIESWLGRPLANEEFGRLDLAERVGCSAVVGIKHAAGKNGDYAQLTGIMKVPQGVPERQAPINPVVVFSFAAFDPEIYRQLPNWLQEVIARSPEYRALGKGGAPSELTVTERLRQMLNRPAVAATAPPAPATPATPLPPLRDDLDDDIPPFA